MDNKHLLYLSGLSKNNPDNNENLQNYMFFSNLRIIKDKVDSLLNMDPVTIDNMLSDGHDWANEHMTTAKDDVEEVYNWITTRKSC